MSVETKATDRCFVVDCDKGARQRRLMVPYIVGEPAFAVLMRGRVLAKEIATDPDNVEKALMRRLSATKFTPEESSDRLFGEVVVRVIDDVHPESTQITATKPPA